MSLSLVEKSKNVNTSQNNNNNTLMEQFVVKRTEVQDVNYFADEGSCAKFFTPIFGKSDLELVFETSLFSVTVHDESNNQPVGLFIFNDTPAGTYKREGYPNIKGNWEDWFSCYYQDIKQDGKNSLWLVFCCINETYCLVEDSLKKIYHRVHLSLYTTLPNIKGTFVSLLSSAFSDIMDADQRVEDDNNYGDNTGSININPFYCIKLLIKYIYDVEVPELEFPVTEEPNTLTVRLNLRDKIFHLIEIRPGTQEDHDDLENIFKDQTPPEVANSYEDFFIAKMIADEDPSKKVLVGQVNDKAVGMLAISTDVNINLLCKSFELDKFDNLVKQDYMRAVRYKRKKIEEQIEKDRSNEQEKLQKDYELEVKSCEPVSQRILLQEYIIKHTERFWTLENLEKRKDTNEQFAIQYFSSTIQNYETKIPNLEKFYGKLKIDAGNCLLIDKLTFYLETLNFFGLPKNYLKGEGHWENYIKQLEKKKAMREAWKRQMQKDSKPTKKAPKKAQKNQDEMMKKKDFDFEPFDTSINLCRKASINARSSIRRIISENKKLIAGFFVNSEGEPSEARCFDLLTIPKKLRDNKVSFAEELNELFCPILTCFGNLQYNKIKVIKTVDNEDREKNSDLKDKKKKDDKKKKKDLMIEEKRELKQIEVTQYLISIGEFFKAVEDAFEYDKVLFEMGLISSDKFELEYSIYKKLEESKLNDNQKSLTDYDKLKIEMDEKNEEKSQEDYLKYSEILDKYNDHNQLPPLPSEILNAFCVKVFFIEQAFESRSTDFLLQAFDAFPNKDYLIVSQPHNYTENTLLEPFIRIPKKVDSLFPEILYILHRESLLITLIKAEYSSREDLEQSVYLFENIGKDSSYLYQICLEAISRPDCKFYCVSLKINSSIVGICLISKEVNIDYYDSHFNVREFINLDKLSKYFHGRILFFSLHKHFVQFTKIAFKEIIRLLNKFSLYFELYTDMPFPEFAKDMAFCKNRKFPQFIINRDEILSEINPEFSKGADYKQLYEDDKIRTKMDGEEREDYDQTESEFCLMILTKRQLSDSRIANNNRIVVVGASDTGISFIESLLSIRYLNFTYVYLVAPGGLLYHHIQSENQNLKVSYTNYELKEMKRLMLENRINVIDSRMKKLNRANKFISLEDGSILYYDYLVLTLGLQEKLGFELSNSVRKSVNDKFQELIKTKENEIQENNNQIQNNQNGQQIGNIKEGKDPKKENLNLTKEIVNIRQNWEKIINSLNFISIDDPRIYSIFSPGNKLMTSLRKNPYYELIVYGRSINLFSFIQGMLERGINGKKLKLIIPSITAHVFPKDGTNAQNKKDMQQQMKDELEFTNNSSLESSAEIEEYLIKIIEERGVKVWKNYNYQSVQFSESHDSIIGYVFSQENAENPEITVTGNYFVTGGLLNVDLSVFHIIHDNGLVYNGRTIIDKNFMTCDPFIFAAGRLCKFSQQYSYIEKNKLLNLER